MLTALGWQFEWQYDMGEEAPTGLVELVPLVVGLEQGLPIPTMNVLVGLRTPNDKEFVVGPNFSPGGEGVNVGMTVAVGKTLRMGEMCLPVNLAIVSNRDGQRYSVTFGWNLRRE